MKRFVAGVLLAGAAFGVGAVPAFAATPTVSPAAIGAFVNSLSQSQAQTVGHALDMAQQYKTPTESASVVADVNALDVALDLRCDTLLVWSSGCPIHLG